LLEGIAEYQKRERRYGGLASDASQTSQHDGIEPSRTRVSAAHTASPHTVKTGRS
jgi:hypothetical protein